MEADYKEALGREFGIIFNRLYTITNQPIARFAEDLRRQGKTEEYLSLLANSFNPATVESLMCRTTLSVGWMGEVYDCDFNQMLGMQMQNGKPLYLWDVTPELLEGWAVRTGEHCLACTAGCGSSCGGALEKRIRWGKCVKGVGGAKPIRISGWCLLGDKLHRTIGLNIPQSRIEIGIAGYSLPRDNRLWHALTLPFRKQRDYWSKPDGTVPERDGTLLKQASTWLAE